MVHDLRYRLFLVGRAWHHHPNAPALLTRDHVARLVKVTRHLLELDAASFEDRPDLVGVAPETTSGHRFVPHVHAVLFKVASVNLLNFSRLATSFHQWLMPDGWGITARSNPALCVTHWK